MSVLDNFKPFNFNEGVPYVSITNNGITFNKSVVIKLQYPEFVILLIDEDAKRIAIKNSRASETHAVNFYKEKASNVISVRWNSRDLLNTIKNMMHWDLSVQGYRAEGTLIKEEDAMVFDLNAAKILN